MSENIENQQDRPPTEAPQPQTEGGRTGGQDQGKAAPATGKKMTNKGQRTMMVRYGKMASVGLFRHSEGDIPQEITHVVVKTERGMEIGEIISAFCHNRGNCAIEKAKMDRYYQESGPNYPVSRHGMVVRFASEMDIKDQQHLNANVKNELKFCGELIQKMNLDMKLVDAEHLFGGERIIFYFMAEGRVDFRELVKELAHQYQTRIEMRQIGARDEARLVADFETCGRECCCKNFLKVLQPVNMRMAKLQKATLDPAKISGRCGRLKCCLRYEDEVYNDLLKKLPRKNSCVLLEKGYGYVIETQVLTQLVKVRLEESNRVVAVSTDEILEMNYKPPKESVREIKPELDGDIQDQDGTNAWKRRSTDDDKGSKSDTQRRAQQAKKPELKQRATNGSEEKSGSQSERKAQGQDQDGNKPKRRRRKRRKKPRSGDGQQGGGQNRPGPPDDL